jgi:DNA-directed RNA polymerase subunit RPC12/RpoP
MSKTSGQPSSKKVEVCPHCGTQLSPWQQVLLGVDRALMCKNCWYRIVLDAIDETKEGKQDDLSNAKDVKQ